jgi:N-methylhydantoinase B
VVLRDAQDGALAVDEAATAAARHERHEVASAGPERQAWESVFDTTTVDRLVAALFRLPRAARGARRTAVYTAVLGELPDGFPRTAPTAEQAGTARRTLDDKISALERVKV